MKLKTCSKIIFLFLLITNFYLLITPSPVSAEEGVFYIHQDHLNSATLVTDSQGTEVSRQTYYPYGITRNSQGSAITERAYTGQVSDVDQTDLYYYNARYYHPWLSIFTQADTVQGPNRYAYVGGNPLIFTDPTGHQSTYCDVRHNGAAMGSNPFLALYCMVVDPIINVDEEGRISLRERAPGEHLAMATLSEPYDWLYTFEAWSQGDFHILDFAGFLPVISGAAGRQFGNVVEAGGELVGKAIRYTSVDDLLPKVPDEVRKAWPKGKAVLEAEILGKIRKLDPGDLGEMRVSYDILDKFELGGVHSIDPRLYGQVYDLKAVESSVSYYGVRGKKSLSAIGKIDIDGQTLLVDVLIVPRGKKRDISRWIITHFNASEKGTASYDKIAKWFEEGASR